MDVATQWEIDQLSAELAEHLTEVHARTARMGALKRARTMLSVGYSVGEVRAFLASAQTRLPSEPLGE